MRDALDNLAGVGTTALGISPDPPKAQKKFDEKHQLGFPLLSDPEHKIADKYGAWGEKKMYGKVREGVIRSTALIDPRGTLVYHWRNVKAAGHAEQVRNTFEELQAR